MFSWPYLQITNKKYKTVPIIDDWTCKRFPLKFLFSYPNPIWLYTLVDTPLTHLGDEHCRMANWKCPSRFYFWQFYISRYWFWVPIWSILPVLDQMVKTRSKPLECLINSISSFQTYKYRLGSNHFQGLKNIERGGFYVTEGAYN